METADQENVSDAELKAIFSRMESRRARIVELCREASLLLGALHHEDCEQGGKLVPRHIGSLTQQRFVELLSPIDPFADRQWTDHMKDVVVGYEHVVKVRPMQKL